MLQRVGRGADVGLVALIVPNAAPIIPVDPVAPAGFELVDEFAEPPAEIGGRSGKRIDTVHEDTAPETVASQIDTQQTNPHPLSKPSPTSRTRHRRGSWRHGLRRHRQRSASTRFASCGRSMPTAVS